MGPVGRFEPKLLDDVKELYLIAGGTGITPIWQILNYALSSKEERNIVLMYANEVEQDILLKPQLDALAQSDPRFKVHYLLANAGDVYNNYLPGYIRMYHMARFMPMTNSSRYLVCPP